MSLDEVFQALVPDFPNVKILALANAQSLKPLKALHEHIKPLDGQIDLCSFDDDFSIDLSNVHFEEKLHSTNDFSVRGYEFLFVFDILNQFKNLQSFLLQCYHALENSGNIFIFDTQNNSYEKIQNTLSECNFVAINTLNEANYNIIGAKKMHGWDGGL